MRRSRQAFSAPSKQMPSSNPKGDLSSIASISASSTISTPSSELLASKPRDPLKREQNSCYEHDNGLTVLFAIAESSRRCVTGGRHANRNDSERRVVQNKHDPAAHCAAAGLRKSPQDQSDRSNSGKAISS